MGSSGDEISGSTETKEQIESLQIDRPPCTSPYRKNPVSVEEEPPATSTQPSLVLRGKIPPSSFYPPTAIKQTLTSAESSSADVPERTFWQRIKAFLRG